MDFGCIATLARRDAREVEEAVLKIFKAHVEDIASARTYAEFDQARDLLLADVLADATSVFDVRIAFEVLYRPLTQNVARLEAATEERNAANAVAVDLLKESTRKAGGEASALEKSLRALEKANAEKELLVAQLREASAKNVSLVASLEKEQAMVAEAVKQGAILPRQQTTRRSSTPASPPGSSDSDGPEGHIEQQREGLMGSLLTPASSFRRRVSALVSKTAKTAMAAVEDRSSLVSRVAELSAHCDNLADALAVLRSENEELRKSADDTTSKLGESLELRRELGQARAEIAQLREEQACTREKLRLSEASCAGLSAQLSQQREIAAMEVSAMRKDLSDAKERGVDLEERLVKKISELRDAQRALTGLTEVASLAEELKTREREARLQLQRCEVAVSRLIGDIAERRLAESSLRESTHDAEMLAAALPDQLEQIAKEMAEMQSRLEEAEKEAQRAKKWRDSLASLEGQLRRAEEENRMLRAQLEKSREVEKSAILERAMEARMKEEEQKNAKLKVQKASAIARSKDLQREGELLSARIKELELNLASPASSSSSLHSRPQSHASPVYAAG